MERIRGDARPIPAQRDGKFCCGWDCWGKRFVLNQWCTQAPLGAPALLQMTVSSPVSETQRIVITRVQFK